MTTFSAELVESFLSTLQAGKSWETTKEQLCTFPDRFDEVDFWDQVNVWVDERLKEALSRLPVEAVPSKIRDKISLALMMRFHVMEPYKQAFVLLTKKSVCPSYQLTNAKCIWRTCDAIWWWAGDTSTDFNHYSKRSLLSAILVAAQVYWLRQESSDVVRLKEFVEQTIGRVMSLTKATQPIKDFLSRFSMFSKA